MLNPKLKAWLSLIVSFALIGLALFLVSGTTRYWQAWAYLAVGAISSIPLTLHIVNDPILLENRARSGPSAEQRLTQKIIVSAVGLPAIATFIVPAFDHRFGWSNVPPWLSLAGDLLILLSMWMVYLVFKENSFGSATVEIAKDQKVISTGPYAICTQPNVFERGGIFHRHVFGTRLLLGAHPRHSHNSWSRLQAVRRRKIPRREFTRLWRISCESPLASHSRRLLNCRRVASLIQNLNRSR